MSFQNNETLENNSNIDFTNECAEGSFIDDLSHLRLSYYRREISFETDSEKFADDSQLTFESASTVIEKDTVLTDISDEQEEDEKQKQRKYFISQIPDLPHPAYTVASIIASASNKMGSGSIRFKYDDKVQVGDGVHGVQNKKRESEFNPTRRSTLKPNSRLD